MAESSGENDFVRLVCAYFVPPVGVFLQTGLGTPFWINLVLTFLGGVPGILHAVWVIATTNKDGSPNAAGTDGFVRLLVAWFIPPAGVFMKQGMGGPFVLNVLLTLCGWAPGVVHAAWVICQPDASKA